MCLQCGCFLFTSAHRHIAHRHKFVMHPIGQHFLAALRDTQVTSEIRDLILKEKVLGFTLFKWNIESAEQLCALTAELHALAKQAGYPLVLAIDQEGGRVERLPEPYLQIPAMRKWFEVYERTGDTKLFYELGKLLAEEVRSAGFNLNFAPVVDVDTNPINPIIGNRAFSSEAEAVYRCAKDLIRGMHAQGVMACLKHFPGHGATSADSHLELPFDDRNYTAMQNIDLLPYKRLIEDDLAPTIMTAHVKYPQIDNEMPATLSPVILSDLLRGELGYQGIIFSDDFLMKAIFDHYGLHDACLKFFKSDGDVVLICKYPDMTLKLISQLRNELQGQLLEKKLKDSYRRIRAMQERYLKPLPQVNPKDLASLLRQHREFVDRHFG